MTRLTKQIKTDIKYIIKEKAITPKEKALNKQKQEFLIKALWSQISTTDYQAWKMLPEALYNILTYTAHSLQVRDQVLGRITAELDTVIAYPRHLSTWMSYTSLPNNLQLEFKELIKEVDAHDAYVKEVMGNLEVTLNSCTTVKKLRELWVNGSEIIDKALGQSQQSPTVYMPMVAIQTLDALVPLP